LRGKISVEIVESLSGYWDFYTMKIKGKQSEPSQLAGFEGIPVLRGSTVYVIFTL